ncbi:MAG: VacJ family lipoprotein [Desulfobacteraceae bacterium]|nr:VacJ family lipoprotein [Desulfobacteraceae bacterium]
MRSDTKRQYKLIIFVSLTFLAQAVTAISADVTADRNHAEQGAAFEGLKDNGFEFEDEFKDQSEIEVFDPLIGYNRFMTNVNDKVYFFVLKPVATIYSIIIPEPGRVAIYRFFKNLLFPIRLVNNLLQLKFEQAGIEFDRFVVNTTIGILGLGDPAKTLLNLDFKEEDFGQTLGHYGIGSGFYIVLPILGPSNLRDIFGMVPDFFLVPINYLDNLKVTASIYTGDIVNNTSLHIGEYESIKKDAIDFYTFIRDGYEQKRKTLIEE